MSHVAPGATESNPRPQCGLNVSPGTQLQYQLLSASPAFVLVNGHHLAPKRTEPSQGYSTAVVRFRRRSFAEHIRVIWNSTSGPGVIYLASQGHTSVITAGSSSPDVDAQTSIGPPGLRGFEATIEEQIIPFFADQGTLGVILFILTLALLVSFKQVLGFVVNGLARVFRSIRGKTRGTGSAPSGQ